MIQYLLRSILTIIRILGIMENKTTIIANIKILLSKFEQPGVTTNNKVLLAIDMYKYFMERNVLLFIHRHNKFNKAVINKSHEILNYKYNDNINTINLSKLNKIISKFLSVKQLRSSSRLININSQK